MVKKKAPVKKSDAKNGAGFYCYIGPSMRGVIQTGTVYIGTREEALAAAALAIARNPLVKTLIVSGDTLPVDRLNVKKPGTALYVNYWRVARGK